MRMEEFRFKKKKKVGLFHMTVGSRKQPQLIGGYEISRLCIESSFFSV